MLEQTNAELTTKNAELTERVAYLTDIGRRLEASNDQLERAMRDIERQIEIWQDEQARSKSGRPDLLDIISIITPFLLGF